MPQPETSHLLQDAVLWEATGLPGRDGNARVTDVPVPLEVRWDDSQKEMADGKGGVVKIDALVQVDREVPLKSVVWRGLLDDLLVGTAFDLSDGPVMTVEYVNYVPDIRNRETFRELGCCRYTGVLPKYAGS